MYINVVATNYRRLVDDDLRRDKIKDEEFFFFVEIFLSIEICKYFCMNRFMTMLQRVRI
jgi:hypothetical protein